MSRDDARRRTVALTKCPSRAMLGDSDVHVPVVLLAHTDEWVSRSLEAVLAPGGYRVFRAGSVAELLKLVRRTPPDALIVDFSLRGVSGATLSQRLRGLPEVGVDVPIILTSASPIGRAERLAAFSAGAWEVCTHPVDCELLLQQLRQLLGARQVASTLRGDSLIDESTGFYSMRGLARRARELDALARRCSQLFACVALALEPEPHGISDDISSHIVARAGQHLAAVWRENGRSCDIIGRLNASEFAIIAASTDVNGARRIVDRLRTRIEEFPLRMAGDSYTVRVRAHYASVAESAGPPVDAMALLLQATQALHAH